MRLCEDTAPEELFQAIEEFNNGEWFECHDTLEELWVGEQGEARDFYQGMLQVAVALYHWRNGNYKGAVLLLERGAEHLRRVRPVCQCVDVAALIASAGRFHQALTALGPERMEEVDRNLIPVIAMNKPPLSPPLRRGI